MSLPCSVPTDWLNNFSQCLFDWQTLASGLLALAAAVWAGSLLRKQISQTQKLSEYERAQRFLAIRCLLPVHLTEIVNYCEAVADELKPLQNSWTLSLSDVFDATENLTFPSESIEHFTRAIEYSNSPCFSKILATVISELQVLNSRISHLNSDCGRPLARNPSNIEIYLIQTAKINSLCGSLYEYARQESENVPESVSWDKVQSSLSIWHVDGPIFQNALNFVERKKEKGIMFECVK